MWIVSGIISAAALIAWLEVPALIRKGYKRELWVFSFVLLLATGLGIAKTSQLNIPNPIDWIMMIFKPVKQAIEQML